MFGGTSSVPVPKGSESCQESSHCGLWTQGGLGVFVHRLCTWCSAQLIAPSERFQPSPTQGAAPWGLCCSLTPALL